MQPRLEGEPAFEACDKVDRLEVFQAHLKCATACAPPAAAWPLPGIQPGLLGRVSGAQLPFRSQHDLQGQASGPSLACLSAAPAVHQWAADAACFACLPPRLTPGCGRHLEKAEREALEKEKAERMRKERQNRDAFRELLLSHAGEGKIHAKLRWKVRPCVQQARCEARGMQPQQGAALPALAQLPAGLACLALIQLQQQAYLAQAEAMLSPACSSAQLSPGWPGAGVLRGGAQAQGLPGGGG